MSLICSFFVPCFSFSFLPASYSKRAAAFGFLAAVGRIGAILGNVAFGEMSESSPTLPLILTGSAMAVGAFLGLALRETRDVHIK
jgi:hypothetical protein